VYNKQYAYKCVKLAKLYNFVINSCLNYRVIETVEQLQQTLTAIKVCKQKTVQQCSLFSK